MDDARNTKKIYHANLHKKKQPKVRSRARWKDEGENDIRKIGIVKWRQVAHDRNRWRRAKQGSHLSFLDSGGGGGGGGGGGEEGGEDEGRGGGGRGE